MSKAGCQVTMLEIQYRMDPAIRVFPSTNFYENRLTDGQSILTRKTRTWLPKNSEFLFFDLEDSEESREADETSYINMPEAEFIVSIYEALEGSHGCGMDIGVITPYKRQVRHLRNAFSHSYRGQFRADIEINTVDGFQGREKDVIIFSCVRSGDRIGFLDDFRRMNVAITRAKFALWIIGKAATLA
jgi:senataxin